MDLKRYRQHIIYNDSIYQDICDDITENYIIKSDTWNMIWENVKVNVEFVIEDVMYATYINDYYGLTNINITYQNVPINIKYKVLNTFK